LIPDPFYRDNENKLQWIADQNWEYATHFDVKHNFKTFSSVLLKFEGLDTYTDIFLNDVKILSTDNMFRTYTIDVKSYKGDSSAIPDSYVPFRNSIIISLAVSWAEVVGAAKLYIGANFEDSPGYPDCRPSYYQAFNKLITVGTKKGDIEIITPVINLKKKEIVLRGMELNVPFHLSWSCYKNSDYACKVCDSCALRLRGFHEAGIQDPIDYI
jgi:queuosine biosynthesis protein QueC